jgi:predicted SnoaL-like aldol condensation-catalyzing enzyme
MTSPSAQSPHEEANKRTVLAFYEAGLNQKNADAAAQHIGSHYTQHNPNAADGIEGFRNFVKGLKRQTPLSRSEIKRVFADGDYVVLHVHKIAEPGSRGNAIVDIFRLDEGKIVEHWDVTQAIPNQTASGNSMF